MSWKLLSDDRAQGKHFRKTNTHSNNFKLPEKGKDTYKRSVNGQEEGRLLTRDIKKERRGGGG